ncbi:importin beta-like SAD2 homolog isoform X1 [Quercus lobata]|uniref:importin beta-like SAD2 homolog isoform X1 n=1 Tax=Quercus lobata TaxID=97700 RepID=UPI00124875BC|nr:importin beta-like SAD2 homolog isoform X1 [Quercus lobata]
MEVAQIAPLLSQTLSPDSNAVRTASEALDRLSLRPEFPFSLLSIAAGGENQGQKVAAATYLKNFTRRSINDDGTLSKVSKEFKEQLLQALLQVEPVVLKVLVEAFRIIVVTEFVKQNSWPELVPDLLSAIQNSNLISNGADWRWNTINVLTVLHALLRPFQYFLNPKVAKEPVPPQLELIAKEILVPLLALFHHLVEKALATHDRTEMETEKVLLTICKCIYFAVRSYMPSTLAPLLPSFCRDLISILGSLSFDCAVTLEDGYMMRLKTGKRSLLIFCALVTRHRKFSDKLMPYIINCALNVVKYSKNISELDFLSERIFSLAFDVISRVLETGPGWRLVSPHFTFLLDSAIFPALVMNEKDILEWEEDADEYMRKNLPSDLDEISGWREDLFTARKSSMNLLGVISMSKGPPMGTSSNGPSASSKRKKGDKRHNQHRYMGELFVLPFLSKFPIPSDANASQTRIINDYFGVLMAYGGLQDFLREQGSGYVTTIIRTRVVPLYTLSVSLPYLVATANWILGELATCLPEGMSADVYSSLLKALAMPDKGDTSCYPVRVSAAGAIAALLENDYAPPEWLPLLEGVIGRISNEDEESSILFQLLSSVVEAGDETVAVHIPYIVSSLVGAISKWIPANLEPWPQVVERGFAALAVMVQCWENIVPEELEQNESSEKWTSGRATIGGAFSALLQRAWLSTVYQLDKEGEASAPPSCIDDSSKLLLSIMHSVTGSNMLLEFKVSELLLVWADLIADWNAWEESEDLSVFDCIKEVVNLHSKYGLKNFLVRQMPSPPAPPVPQRSIIEGIGVFVSEAILQYPSATCRACSCVHVLLHVPSYSFETDGVKQSLAIAFSQAAFSHFREIQSKPSSLWKPLLLAISSCYLCYTDMVEGILEKGENGGFAIWASALGFLLTSSFEPRLSATSEIKLVVMALAQVVERLLGLGKPSGVLLHDCFTSLLEASVRLKEVQEEKEEDEDDGQAEDGDDDDDDVDDEESEDDDEESEAEEHEETEEEFLDRYAKAAVALENGIVIEEGDEEDEDHETELGSLEEVDQKRVVFSLIEKHHQVLIQGQALPLQLISSFVNAYPEFSLFFQQSR